MKYIKCMYTLTILYNTITIRTFIYLTGKTDSHTLGTTDFVVDQLVFHSTHNTKFTLIYAIDAIAKDIK